ncbi:MAG: pentapeptide repeat-containing protein [Mesorhizobium sp.]|nr:MAG: pentapeptide repeat-containing protein [Mesorhizobium sp.]
MTRSYFGANGMDGKHLIDAVNSAGDAMRTTWLTLVSLVTYLFVTVGSTTHLDLLLEKPQALPILGIDLPLATFYAGAPLLLLIIHGYYLLQVYLAERRVAELRDYVRAGSGGRNTKKVHDERRDEVRSGLNAALVVQNLAGDLVLNGWARWIVACAVSATSVIAPVMLLIAFQIAFLPYHSVPITWWHRIILVVDIGMLLFIWPGWLRQSVRREDVKAPKRKGFWRQAAPAKAPEGIAPDVAPNDSASSFARFPAFHAALPVALALCLIYFSIGIATIPDETTEFLGLPGCPKVYLWWYEIKSTDGQPLPAIASGPCATKLLFGGPPDLLTGRLKSPFARNLVVPYAHLGDRPNDELKVRSMARQFDHDLARRDLSHAILISGDFRGVRFDGANLTNAQLTGGKFDYASFCQRSVFGEIDGCATLDGSELSRTTFRGADLSFSDLRHTRATQANFSGAKLYEAHFDYAHLDFPVFDDAKGAAFDGARLESVRAEGANFSGATANGAYIDGDFRGANFSGLKAVGAYFQQSESGLAGDETPVILGGYDAAQFAGAQLTGAEFHAGLTGADFSCADMQGVDFHSAKLSATSFRTATVWGSKTGSVVDSADTLWFGSQGVVLDSMRITSNEALCQLEPLEQRDIDSARTTLERVASGFPGTEPQALPPSLKRAIDRVGDLSLTQWDSSSKDWWLKRQGGGPRQPTEADVAARLRTFVAIACIPQAGDPNASHPSIAAALLRQEMWKDYPDFATLFAKVVLDPDHCPNAKGMHHDVRKQYRELSERVVPKDNPLFQPETYYIKARKS